MQVAILGATGLVGRKMLELLEARSWVDANPILLASERSAGTALRFRGDRLVCRPVADDSFEGVDIALFSAGAGPSLYHGPRAAAAGAWVVDNSSAFRTDPDLGLIVPEINGRLVQPLAAGSEGGIIANPNCSTIQIAMVVAPLDRAFGLTEVHTTTLQAVSGAGQSAVDEFRGQLAPESRQESGSAQVFPRPIAGNVLPVIGQLHPDGSCEEEVKVGRELRKILDRDENLAVSCTVTRVPVFNCHSAAVRVLLRGKADVAAAREALSGWPGVRMADRPEDYATPLEVDGSHLVHVGRLRPDPSHAHGLLMWVVADNLLKGAALNAIQIASILAGAEEF